MRRLMTLALVAGLAVLPGTVVAQGKGGAKAKPAAAQKKVTPNDAVSVSRDILVKHGYVFVRSEMVGTSQVIYYRRGNMGRGKGQGPLEKMVVRPSNSIVVFDGGPSGVLADIRIKLGI